jgi:hypothetical protein
MSQLMMTISLVLVPAAALQGQPSQTLNLPDATPADINRCDVLGDRRFETSAATGRETCRGSASPVYFDTR